MMLRASMKSSFLYGAGCPAPVTDESEAPNQSPCVTWSQRNSARLSTFAQRLYWRVTVTSWNGPPPGYRETVSAEVAGGLFAGGANAGASGVLPSYPHSPRIFMLSFSVA